MAVTLGALSFRTAFRMFLSLPLWAAANDTALGT